MNSPGRCPLQSPDVPFYISAQMIFFLPRGTFKQQPLFFPSNRHLISPSKPKRRKPHAPESAELQGRCQAAPRRRRCLWWPHVTAGGSCRACASPAVTQAGPNLVPAFASAIPAYPYGMLGWEKEAVMPMWVQSLTAASPAGKPPARPPLS